VPIANQALQAQHFLASSGEGLEEISETRSIFGLLKLGHTLSYAFGFYTYLVLLVPVILVLCIWKLLKESEPARVLLWISIGLGLLLLLTQIRLHYFGSFALFLPLLLLLDERVRTLALKPVLTWTLAGVVFLAACSPGPRQRFFMKQVVAGDPDYTMNRALFISLGKICREKPGVVLANPLDGNYLRFHTNCDVIGTNFLLTPQDIAKNRAERAMLSLPAAAILDSQPQIDYLFIRRDEQFVLRPNGMLVLSPDHPSLVDPPLVDELLRADPQHLPQGYRLLDELVYAGTSPRAYARIFKIER
jgi:hypothetical protein